jgi:hypothetical protein
VAEAIASSWEALQCEDVGRVLAGRGFERHEGITIMHKRILGLAVSAGVLVTAVPAAASASASSPADSSGGWTSVTYPSTDAPAGTVCQFELRTDYPTQAVQERIAATYPDGTPLQTDFRGPLIAHYTNEATGRTVDEDLSGAGTLYSLPDKSSLWLVPDNLGVTIHPGDPFHTAGEYVLAGPSVVSVSPTHQINVLYQTRTIDVCAVLS